MRSPLALGRRGWTGSVVLLGVLTLTGGGLVTWKRTAMLKA